MFFRSRDINSLNVFIFDEQTANTFTETKTKRNSLSHQTLLAAFSFSQASFSDDLDELSSVSDASLSDDLDELSSTSKALSDAEVFSANTVIFADEVIFVDDFESDNDELEKDFLKNSNERIQFENHKKESS